MNHFDTGTTCFMLFATSLVMLMTPGLAFFYGGFVGRKNVITIMFQSFVSMGVTTLLFWAVGYTMCFSGDMASHTDFGGFIGNFDKAFLMGINIGDAAPVGNFPLFVFIAYQLMVAIITPALITGAFANRVTFKAWLLFLIGWLLFVYFPFAHMVWGGGLLQSLGVLDFGGGIVVHNIAGMAALASVIYMGKRKKVNSVYHSIPLIAIGTGLLWFGWFGFNAGNAYAANELAAQAFLNTFVSGATGAMAWMIASWMIEKKPTFVGFMTGALAGLVVTTPTSGYVTVSSSILIGAIAGIVCFAAVNFKNKMKWDDALDVWGVHGVGGFIGIVLLGVLGSKAVNPAPTLVPWEGGLIHGGTQFFLIQVVSVVFSSIYAFGLTWGMLALINKMTPVRVSEVEELMGLDGVLHGEDAYMEEEITAPPNGKEPVHERMPKSANLKRAPQTAG
jgi:ammonium transporter, Amt family